MSLYLVAQKRTSTRHFPLSTTLVQTPTPVGTGDGVVRRLPDDASLAIDTSSKSLEDPRNQTKATLQSFYSFAKPIVDLSLRLAADLGSNFRHIDSYFPQQIPPDICAIIRD
jgi:hypothetical protein